MSVCCYCWGANSLLLVLVSFFLPCSVLNNSIQFNWTEMVINVINVVLTNHPPTHHPPHYDLKWVKNGQNPEKLLFQIQTFTFLPL